MVPQLAASAAARVAAAGMTWAVVHQAEPGVLGLPRLAPYDRVLVSAGGGPGLSDEATATTASCLSSEGRVLAGQTLRRYCPPTSKNASVT